MDGLNWVQEQLTVPTALVIQPLLTGLNLIIPPNTTYGIAIQGVVGGCS